MMATITDFNLIDIRVGKIITVENFPEAKNPSYKLLIDFGPDVGIKKSCAQLVHNYQKNELIGKLVIGIVNFPPRQIGPTLSEVLVLGVPDEKKHATLLEPQKEVALGVRVY
jgi:tRNA-binding protein